MHEFKCILVFVCVTIQSFEGDVTGAILVGYVFNSPVISKDRGNEKDTGVCSLHQKHAVSPVHAFVNQKFRIARTLVRIKILI